MSAEGIESGKLKSPQKSRKGLCLRVLVAITFLAMLGVIIGLTVLLLREQEKDKPNPPPGTTPTTQPPVEPPSPHSETGRYRFAAVASDSKVCSKIGNDILARQGGSSADAAIASLLCLGVVHTHSMGIGGGFLMTVHDRNKNNVDCLVSREVAPLDASKNMYINSTASSTMGGTAVAVPGELAGLGEMHRRYGKLPWATLVEPAIRLCEDGVEVTGALKTAIDVRIENIRKSPTLSAVFLKADGTPLNAGDIMKRPTLAKTLRTIAAEGAEAFYNGSLAEDIVRDIQADGGIIRLEDLATYRPVWKDPVSVTLDNGDYTLYGPPPPSSAGVLQYILNILDGYTISADDLTTDDRQILLQHRLVEALKFGFGKRSHLGDEDYVNVTQWKAMLQDSAYADQTRGKINDSSVLPLQDYEPAFELPEDAGTSHLSVYGSDGLAISVTSTINTYFGSKLMGNRTGIIFNNEMDDFSTPGTSNAYGVPASPTNYIAPGKRPMSSMSPTIITDKEGVVRMLAGASGGTRIISGTLEVIMNSLWLGQNMTSALDRWRLHHQLLPDVIRYEKDLPESHITGLKRKGHEMMLFDGTFCVVQAIRNECETPPAGTMINYDDYCISAGSDIRKGGAPDGY